MAAGRSFILFLLLVLVGCGYRPLGTEPLLAERRPSLAIPLFTNRSTEVGLEALMANAFVQAFSESRSLRLTTPEEADLVLEGKVASVAHSSVAFQDITRSLVRRATVRVEMTLKRRDTGKIIWKDSEVFAEDYVVDPNYHIGEATKAMGLRRAAITLARRVLDKILLVI